MYNNPILDQAALNGQQMIAAPNQERDAAQFAGRYAQTPGAQNPALTEMFAKQRNNAMMAMRARLAELNARKDLHDQKMGLFYNQLAFQHLQDKWAKRNEIGGMIGTGLGAAGMGLGGLFKPQGPDVYDPSTDPSLDALYHNHDNPNAILNYEPVPDWFARTRGR